MIFARINCAVVLPLPAPQRRGEGESPKGEGSVVKHSLIHKPLRLRHLPLSGENNLWKNLVLNHF